MGVHKFLLPNSFPLRGRILNIRGATWKASKFVNSKPLNPKLVSKIPTGKQIICYKCNGEGHLARDCLEQSIKSSMLDL